MTKKSIIKNRERNKKVKSILDNLEIMPIILGFFIILLIGLYNINHITGNAVAEDEVFGSLVFAFFLILAGIVFYMVVVKIKISKRKKRIAQIK